MFYKMAFIILCIGAIGIGLLALRQQKIETIHDISLAYRHQREAEQTLWALQAELARRCRTDELRRRLEELNLDWHKIPAPSSPDPVGPASQPIAARMLDDGEYMLGG